MAEQTAEGLDEFNASDDAALWTVTGVLRNAQDAQKGHKTALVNQFEQAHPQISLSLQEIADGQATRFVMIGTRAQISLALTDVFYAHKYEPHAERLGPVERKIENHEDGVENKDDWSGGKTIFEIFANKAKESISSLLDTGEDIVRESFSESKLSAASLAKAALAPDFVAVHFLDGTQQYREVTAGLKSFDELCWDRPPQASIYSDPERKTSFPPSASLLALKKYQKEEEVGTGDEKTMAKVVHLYVGWYPPPPPLPPPPPQLPPPPPPQLLPRDIRDRVRAMSLQDFARIVEIDEEDTGFLTRAKIKSGLLVQYAEESRSALEGFLDKRVPGLSGGAIGEITLFFFPVRPEEIRARLDQPPAQEPEAQQDRTASTLFPDF